MKPIPFYWGRAALALIAVMIVFAVGWARLRIEADILAFMPQTDPVISDALHIFRNHPIQDQMIVDVGIAADDTDLLLASGRRVEEALRQSGLFKRVGMRQFETLMPELAFHVLQRLPFLFSAEELEAKVRPLLEPQAVKDKLVRARGALMGLEGIGQEEFLAKDPLGLRDIVMARLIHLAPTREARIQGGQILSVDGRHLLVVAESDGSGTDTAFARKVADLIETVDGQLNQDLRKRDVRVVLTPMGAYRIALDNELIVRRDVHRAILFATAGIVLLLVFTFPRPLLGLLSLLPAFAGASMALAVLSLLHETVALMVLGFGGALISISVDHGIAYLLFLDRPHQTYGRDASREVRAVGLIAALTTIGAFATLALSGFPILVQLGQFTALGIAFSFLFVHTVYPVIFTTMPAATGRKLPLQNLVNACARAGKKGALAAAAVAAIMLAFAKPEFNVDVGAMNTVSAGTRAAEAEIAGTWSLDENRLYLMIEAADLGGLQEKIDRMMALVEQEIHAGYLAAGFLPSMVFPGETLQRRNVAAWKGFWDTNRVGALKKTLLEAGAALDFSDEAFAPFFRSISAGYGNFEPQPMPPDFFALMGVVAGTQGKPWRQVSALSTGPNYDSTRFFAAVRQEGRLFDPALFANRLGGLLFATFVKMLAIIGLTVTILLFLFFVDLSLTLIALLPVIFAMICTLGTLKLIGHPLDIPGLMLGIVVFGMGIDYSLFWVRSFQRYGDPSHPHFGLIRSAVFLASASTLIGFGMMATAQHSLLRSAGITSLLGIGYSLLGTFLILPPVLARRLQVQQHPEAPPAGVRERVLRRYVRMDACPRLFARFKLHFDPMFKELPGILDHRGDIRTIIDIGCGFGVPACWMLERFEEAVIYGIDPDPERVQVAARAVGARGVISKGAAPDLPSAVPQAQLAMMLDMIHYLSDQELSFTLNKIRDRLLPSGYLLLRAPLVPQRPRPWAWWFENARLKLLRIPATYRSPEAIGSALSGAGFEIEYTGLSGADGDMTWFFAKTND